MSFKMNSARWTAAISMMMIASFAADSLGQGRPGSGSTGSPPSGGGQGGPSRNTPFIERGGEATPPPPRVNPRPPFGNPGGITPLPGGGLPGGGCAPGSPGLNFGGGAFRYVFSDPVEFFGTTIRYDSWQQWWRFNRDPYVNFNRRGSNLVASGRSNVGVGRGKNTSSVLTGVSPEDFRRLIRPVLMKALDDSNNQVVAEAILALGRTATAEDAPVVLRDVVEGLEHKHETVKRASILSLGMLGTKMSRPILKAILEDSERGRRYVLREEAISSDLRSVAAIALGMIGDPRDIQDLITIFEEQLNTETDLRCAVLVGLGQFDDGHGEILPFLLDVMSRPQLNRAVRACAPMAIAKLGSEEAAVTALGSMVRMSRSLQTDGDTQRSCLTALGALATMADGEALDLLYETLETDSEAPSQFSALTALGRIGTRTVSTYSDHQEAHEKLLKTLLTQTSRPKRYRSQQPWAALSLATYVRAYRGLQPQVHEQAHRVLNKAFRGTKSSDIRAAMAIALGILETEAGGNKPVLDAFIKHDKDVDLRASLAASLGMIENRDSLPALDKLLKDEETDGMLRVEIARAMALMDDSADVEPLHSLAQDGDLEQMWSSISSLGWLGRRDSILPLTDIYERREAPGEMRALSIRALSYLAMNNPHRHKTELSVDTNYLIPNLALNAVIDAL